MICGCIRAQDNRRCRSETSYVPWVRRTLFYVLTTDAQHQARTTTK